MEIGNFTVLLETLYIDSKVYDALAMFQQHKGRSFIPVINRYNEPVGLVREQDLRDFTYTRFGRDLLKRKFTSEFTTPCPVVSDNTQFEDLIQTPTFQERKEGFIVVCNGKYFGFLPVSTLIEMYEEHRLNTQLQLLQAQKMESIGTLAGGIAHDFNNILASLSGHLSLTQLKLQSGETSTIFKYINTMETLLTRAASLTQQLLGFARGGNYQIIPININEVIHHVLSILRRTFDPSISFEENYYPSIGIIEGDRGQMEQVFMNLFINARDAMPQGGKLTITTRNLGSSDALVISKLNNYAKTGIEIEVCDSGTGIPPEVRKRIFEPFYTTKAPGQGTGMGLAMVYGIVKNHGGYIDVKSQTGKGTSFYLYFPQHIKEKIEIVSDNQPISQPLAAATSHDTIMVVDDDPHLLPALQEFLESEGCKVVAFHDGNDAIRHYTEHSEHIHLVLLDMLMPNLSGQQVFHELRKINPSVKVIFMSGYNTNKTVQDLLKYERTDFIQKPFYFDSLVKKWT